MGDRLALIAMALIVALLLLVPTAAGAAADILFGTAPLALAVGVGAGVLLATVMVTRVVLSRYEQLAPSGQREDVTE